MLPGSIGHRKKYVKIKRDEYEYEKMRMNKLVKLFIKTLMVLTAYNRVVLDNMDGTDKCWLRWYINDNKQIVVEADFDKIGSDCDVQMF